MPRFRIAAIPGDGIGGEVLGAGLRVLEQVADLEVTTFPWGSDYYLEHRRMLADDALEQLQPFDAIYFGAAGSREVPDHVTLWGLRLAMARPRRQLTSVTKRNAQQYAMVLWDEVFTRVAADYPDVATESELVDAMAARFVLRPHTLDVVVASNLHGDILSDLGSALAGSLGLAASANLNPDRRFPSMFEPVHGSAPDIAGQGVANPLGAIGSGAMMLDHLGRPDLGARVRAAIAATLRDGIRTRDLGGAATTAEATLAVIARL